MLADFHLFLRQPSYQQVVRSILFLSFLAVVLPVHGQDNASYFKSNYGVQYGYSIKAVIEFTTEPKEFVHVRLGLSGGIGAFTGHNWFYPALNADLMFYHGGIGSSRPGIKKGNFIDVEGVISYTIVAGANNRMREDSKLKPGIRNYPLYYFSNWTLPTLQNPYNYSLSWGGNYVIFLTRTPYLKNQFVGFVNAHVDRVQGSYTNDGPPFFLPFGDKFDRYHTGGGFPSFHGNDNWVINLVEVGYNKYTGYSPGTYEISNQVGTNYMLYHDVNQNYYNKSNLQINIANTSRHYGLSVQVMNYPRSDLQHRIHNKNFYPFHLVPYDGFVSAGGAGYFQKTYIGLK